MSGVQDIPSQVICVDIETTGLSPDTDRIVQIACVELHDGVRLARTSTWLINPGIPIPRDAVRVHGITTAMVENCPGFSDIREEFLSFIGNAPLVAHNASFDIGFLNAELQRCGMSPLRNHVIDTVPLLRKVTGLARANLNAGCRFFGISLEQRRHRHDALVDAELLAELFGYLIGAKTRAPMGAPSRHTSNAQPLLAFMSTSFGPSAPGLYPDRGLGRPTPEEDHAHSLWRKALGIPTVVALLCLTACVAGGDPPSSSTHLSREADTRIEIRDDAKPLDATDRVIRTRIASASAPTPATDAPPPSPTSPSPASSAPAVASRDIVDARALAVLATLLGAPPPAAPLFPSPALPTTSMPPTGRSPVLELIPR